jgi:Na+/proline symporter
MHPVDLAIVLASLAVVLLLGRRATAGARNEESFFLAGRKFGKLYQFFLNFGNTTEANTAVSTVSFVYREGASGAWLPLQMIFLNPYYWFMNVWFRRVRLVTTAEIFETRLGSRRLAGVYSVFQTGVAVMGIGFSNFIAYKIMAGMVPGLAPTTFYAAYVAIIGLYLAMGGLVATVMTQVFQGILVLASSVMLLPFAWRALGAATLRERLPGRMFDLFGPAGGEQYTWYAVLALLAVSIVQINGNIVNMGLGGSARDEASARFGAVSGTYGKRVLIVLWAFLGLVTAALFRGPARLADPDLAWGALSRQLLGPGFLGLMLAGILAANMASTASKTMAVSAVFVRNLYRPFSARLGDAGAVRVGRLAVAGALGASVAAALAMDHALTVMKLILTLNLPFGAAVLLMFFWRRLTRAAVWCCIVLSVAVIFVVPFGIQAVPALSGAPSLLVFSETAGAGSDRGIPLYFEAVERRDPGDPSSPAAGRGRFNVEAWVLARAGLPVQPASRSGLLAVQFFFDALFPLAILVCVSLVTRPPPRESVDRFFGIMKTPVGATPELEAAGLDETRRDPGRFDHLKLFPGSSWEFTRWNRADTVGFLVCCAISGAILGAFWLALHLLR